MLLRASAFAYLAFCLMGCATELPAEKHSVFSYPDDLVYTELPTGKFKDRPYEVLGWVRSKAHFPTLEQDVGNQVLCKNYFNKAAAGLLKEAAKAQGDAVIQVRSIVIFMDGSVHEYPTPECSDDGAEGEVLVKGVAIRWKPLPKKVVLPAQNQPSAPPLAAP